MSTKKETENATAKRREKLKERAEFYKQELDLLSPYRDYLKCEVEIMQLNKMRDRLIEEQENWESLHKKEV